MFRNVFSGCVSDRSSQHEALRSQKLKFGASLSSSLKHGYLPGPLVEILVHIAKEGTATADLFRRPGNPNDTRRIVKRLTEGKQVIFANYSFYTLASVVKKFLLKIPGGVFTPEGEAQLLNVLSFVHKVDQIKAVHNFIETLTTAHQQLIALLFGTWFRIVTFQEQNSMSVEALSRSVAGSMFHTCAEDPAKVEKASRIMQFLIDNFGVADMFGFENIRFFTEATHTGIHIQELYQYTFVADTQSIPQERTDIIEVTRMEHEEEKDEEEEKEMECNENPQSVLTPVRHSREGKGSFDNQLIINTSTLSAPEVSLVPSPDVSKRPKSLEDNLNEVRSHYQSRCLSRYNSVKRKQLERLRQRSDWFLSPTVREKNNSRKGRLQWEVSRHSDNIVESCSQNFSGSLSSQIKNGNKSHHSGNKQALQKKNSGSSVTKAASETAVTETLFDGDSVFTDNTSRSESPASEPMWSHVFKFRSRDVIHSDPIAELVPLEVGLPGGGSGADLSMGSRGSFGSHRFFDLSPSSVRSGALMEERVGDAGTDDDDDENTPPTILQEEEDTLMTSSLPDLPLQSSMDESCLYTQDLDKQSPTDPFAECLTDEQGNQTEQEGSFVAEAPPQTAQPKTGGFIPWQHSLQGSTTEGTTEADQIKGKFPGDGGIPQRNSLLKSDVHLFGDDECTYSDQLTDS
ncbi:unnamed protein product [Candidula unifasciata]|uniref:Rho-GAP domain-containing protein n=1 Tax=Candidula unifasciata TaxID=100452 RepID=A0A8S4A6F5_9EUPU|nr:unnamed protein product [Candidula unifasciata]